jgi:hypothetical protein
MSPALSLADSCGAAVSSSAPSPTFAAGDLISLQATPSSTPDNWGSIRWGVTLAS